MRVEAQRLIKQAERDLKNARKVEEFGIVRTAAAEGVELLTA